MSTSITDRRKLTIKHATGSVEWHVHEFDDGRAYMLDAVAASVGFSAHFTAEQWAEFQKMIAGADR